MSDRFKTDDTRKPVRIVSGGVARIQPCHYRKHGLAVSNSAPHVTAEEMERRKAAFYKTWDSSDCWVVTHERSGMEVCAYPTLPEAATALQVILLVTKADWSKSLDAVWREVMSNEVAQECVSSMAAGRLLINDEECRKYGVRCE